MLNLRSDRMIQTFGRRSQLPLVADQVWQIQTGFVRTLLWLDDDIQTVVGVWGPGDWVGPVFSSDARSYSAECLMRVTLVTVPLGQWSLGAEESVQREKRMEGLLAVRSQRRPTIALLRLLEWLGREFGRATPEGWEIKLRLTHQDLADLSGFSRVTVTRAVQQLEQRGLIDRTLHSIVVREESLWCYHI